MTPTKVDEEGGGMMEEMDKTQSPFQYGIGLQLHGSYGSLMSVKRCICGSDECRKVTKAFKQLKDVRTFIRRKRKPS
jgi:hypothetical protein